MKTEREDGNWTSIFILTFGTTRLAELSALALAENFILMEISWYSFLLQGEWSPGLRHADRTNWSLENLQGPYRESHPEPPVFWHYLINGTIFGK
jgi:hypothetical protein